MAVEAAGLRGGGPSENVVQLPFQEQQRSLSSDSLGAEGALGGTGSEMGGVQSAPAEEGPSSVAGPQSGSFLLTVPGDSRDPLKTHQRLRTQAIPVAS